MFISCLRKNQPPFFRHLWGTNLLKTDIFNVKTDIFNVKNMVKTDIFNVKIKVDLLFKKLKLKQTKRAEIKM